MARQIKRQRGEYVMWMMKSNFLAPVWGATFTRRELANRTDVYYAMKNDPHLSIVKVIVREDTARAKLRSYRRAAAIPRVASGTGGDTDSQPGDGDTGSKSNG
jgi:hypothetical protein